MRKIIFCIFLLFSGIFVFAACGGKEPEDPYELRAPFREFLLENGYGTTITIGKGEYEEECVQIELPSGQTCRYFVAYKEPEGLGARILCGALSTDWDFMDYEDMKTDLAFLKTIVDVFAAENGWEENYELYSEMLTYMGTKEDSEFKLGYTMYYTYDNQTQKLYIAAKHEKYIELCRQFNATSLEEIAADEKGLQLLLDNGLGEIRDGEYKTNGCLTSTYVFVDDNENKLKFLDLYFINRQRLIIK